MEFRHILYNHETRKKLTLYLEAQDSRILSMLVWCGIGVLCNYVIMLLNSVRFYANPVNGHYRYLMLLAIAFLFIPFGKIVWKGFSYEPKASRMVINEFLHFDVEVNNRQIKLLSGLMISYFFIVQVSFICCWYHAALGLTMVTGSLLYGLGLFLLVRLAHARKIIISYLNLIDRHLNNRQAPHS